MGKIIYRTCDILIVGAGLAGLRAGISALSCGRDLHVRLASQAWGPSGSSFTNPNHALGMIVCHNDKEKERFVKTATAMAPPGIIQPDLTMALAEESGALYQDMVQAGLSFKKNPRGKNRRHSACFLQKPRMAYVFTGLASAFFIMKKRFLHQKGQIWEGLSLIDLVKNDENRIIGAIFVHQPSKQIWAIHCQALVMATGGSTGLFPRSLTDHGNLGIPLALMHGAGAEMINMNYLQYTWHDQENLRPWPCWQIHIPGVLIRTRDNRELPVPRQIADLCAQRQTHVPLAHGTDDSALDNYLLDHATSHGTLGVKLPDQDWKSVALHAHAMNGGVRIDTMARTGIPGLFACGECTGGMHGANRVGGAMVLSTQVFGKKAGASAARFVHDPDFETGKRFKERVKHQKASHYDDPMEFETGLARLKTILTGCEGPMPRPDITPRLDMIRSMKAQARDRRLHLALSCAVLILEKST
ncbi:MAG: FAD-binding protein [Proteobacteria bacterium]|nr:FAD-binding protein [Pseudomonadota bacterium]